MRHRISKAMIWMVVVLVAGMVTLGSGSPTLAVTGSTFESADGNLIVNTAGNHDWANASPLQKGLDITDPKTDDSFGQGSKEDDPAPSVVTGQIPPNKSDLTRFYVSTETTSTARFVYLAWERANVLGSANMDFEFNQSTALTTNGVTHVRTAGDLLVTFDFTNGGSTPVLGLLKWVTGGATSQCFSNNALPCWGNHQDLSGLSEADGAVNTSDVTDPIGPNNPRTLPAGTFGEAGINLTAANVFPAGACTRFGSAFLKSRSSSTFTSEMKDFIAPISVDLSNCQPATINITKTDNAATPNPIAGAVFTLYKDVAPLAGSGPGPEDTTAANTVGTCTTSAAGTCSFANVVAGDYWVAETTTPAGYTTAAAQHVTVALTSATQTIPLTFSDVPVPGTINIHKVDDANPGNAVSGAVFTLYTDAAPLGGTAPGPEDTTSVGTCTTNASGNCSFATVALGQYWVVETTTPSGYTTAAPQNVVIGLGNAANTGQTLNLTFVDPRLTYKVIVIVCQESNGALHPSGVTVDGALTTSMATAPAGLTAAQLCGISGDATYTGKFAGDHPADVSIPR